MGKKSDHEPGKSDQAAGNSGHAAGADGKQQNQERSGRSKSHAGFSQAQSPARKPVAGVDESVKKTPKVEADSQSTHDSGVNADTEVPVWLRPAGSESDDAETGGGEARDATSKGRQPQSHDKSSADSGASAGSKKTAKTSAKFTRGREGTRKPPYARGKRTPGRSGESVDATQESVSGKYSAPRPGLKRFSLIRWQTWVAIAWIAMVIATVLNDLVARVLVGDSATNAWSAFDTVTFFAIFVFLSLLYVGVGIGAGWRRYHGGHLDRIYLVWAAFLVILVGFALFNMGTPMGSGQVITESMALFLLVVNGTYLGAVEVNHRWYAKKKAEETLAAKNRAADERAKRTGGAKKNRPKKKSSNYRPKNRKR